MVGAAARVTSVCWIAEHARIAVEALRIRDAAADGVGHMEAANAGPVLAEHGVIHLTGSGPCSFSPNSQVASTELTRTRHGSVSSFLVPALEFAFDHLAIRRARQTLDENKLPGDFELCKPRGEKLYKSFGVQ